MTNHVRFENERATLENERSQIVARLSDTRGYGLAAPMNDSVGELSGYDQHPADLGSEMFEREKDIALREHDRIRLEKVEQALQRMEQGDYGVCEGCDGNIEPLRLSAEPAATYCVSCAQSRQTIPLTSDRPIEEAVLSPPFARTNLDGADQTGFDGEDSWQAVAAMDDECDEEETGYVDPMDAISNDQYKRQLP